MKQLASQQSNNPIKIKLFVEAVSLLTSQHGLTSELSYKWLTQPCTAFNNQKPLQLFHSKAASRVIEYLKQTKDMYV